MLTTPLVLLLISISVGGDEPARSANCIIENLNRAVADKLAVEGAVFVETGSFSPYAGSLLTSAPACMARHHWTADQTQLAGRYTIAKLGLPSAEGVLRKKGIDPARLRAIYRNLPANTRERPLGRPDAASLLAKAQAEGIVPSNSDLPMLGRYVGLLNLVDAIPVILS